MTDKPLPAGTDLNTIAGSGTWHIQGGTPADWATRREAAQAHAEDMAMAMCEKCLTVYDYSGIDGLDLHSCQ